MKRYDLIVIGAGPGGAAAAIVAAHRGAQVLLLERGSFPRHRVCGEFVSAESLELLQALLGRAAETLVQSAIRIPGARLFLDGQAIESAIQPAAASIARFDLDLALWNAAAKSGVAQQDRVTVTQIARTKPGSFKVSSTHGEFHSRAVVDASGRWSNLNRSDPGNQPRWIGIKGHFQETNPSRTVDLYFFPGGYCGVQPVSLIKGRGSRINVCAMVRADRARDFARIFALHPALQERSTVWTPLMEPVATSPLIFRKPRPVRDCMIAVGDAAGFVDPFVGDGISLALRSGALAAECLSQTQFGINALPLYSDRYEAELAPIYRASSTLRRLLKLPVAIRRPALALLKNSPKLQEFIVARTRRVS
jgi:flavin-dependent dehydrogenase